MKKKMLQGVFLLLGMGMTTLVAKDYSNNEGAPYPLQVKKPQLEKVQVFEPGYEVEPSAMAHGYSYPARINVQDEWDFYLYTSFLYWQMIADGYDFVYHQNQDTRETEFFRWPHKYKPAFKAGCAMHFHNHDDWQLLGEYMRYYSSTRMHVTKKDANDYIVVVFWAAGQEHSSEYTLGAEGRLRIGIDAANLSLGRPFYSGSHLTLNVFYGIRAAWIHHYLDTKYWQLVEVGTRSEHTEEIPAWYTAKNWRLGPRLGFDAKFLLGSGVRLYGKGAVTLAYWRSRVESNLYAYRREEAQETEALDPALYSDVKSALLKTELELGLGFGWGMYLDDQNWNIDLSVGYDMHIFLHEENVSNSIVNIVYNSIPDMDLCLHGLTVTGRLDF